MEFSYHNLEESLIGLSQQILEKGNWRETRGFRCLEFNEPILVHIEDPTDRYVYIKERKWNKTLPWIESLWILLGKNDLDLVVPYAGNLKNFSDDGETMRAGYGPRIRCFNGSMADYNDYSEGLKIDQLRFVIETLKKDINSRQALISIHDPIKDDFVVNQGGLGLKITKDQPCTRTLQFMMVNGKLDCTVTMRSNDLLWGYSAVNVFNFTFMQEYIANILDVEIGRYHHFMNNLHIYEDKKETIEKIAKTTPTERTKKWAYPDAIYDLVSFDSNIEELYYLEDKIKKGADSLENSMPIMLFRDWENVIRKHHNPEYSPKFFNPRLNKLYYGSV